MNEWIARWRDELINKISGNLALENFMRAVVEDVPILVECYFHDLLRFVPNWYSKFIIKLEN